MNHPNEYITQLKIIGKSKHTTTAYQRDLDNFMNFLKIIDKTIYNIDKNIVQLYINHIVEKGLQPRSVRRQYASIHSWLKWNNFLISNILIPKLPRKHKDSLTVEQVKQLLNSLHKDQSDVGIRDTAIIETLYCGPRNSEIRNLPVWRIDFKEQILRTIAKGNEEFDYYLSPTAAKALQKHINNQKAKTIFQVTGKGLIDIIKRRTKFLNINVTPHTLRRSFARHLYEKTKDIELVRDALNHKSIETTIFYIGVSSLRKKEMIQNFYSEI